MAISSITSQYHWAAEECLKYDMKRFWWPVLVMTGRLRVTQHAICTVLLKSFVPERSLLLLTFVHVALAISRNNHLQVMLDSSLSFKAYSACCLSTSSILERLALS